jgi:hypothetical protein
MSPLISIFPLPLRSRRCRPFLFQADEFGHRLPALGNNHGLALGLDLVHDGETLSFELAGGNSFGRSDHGHKIIGRDSGTHQKTNRSNLEEFYACRMARSRSESSIPRE